MEKFHVLDLSLFFNIRKVLYDCHKVIIGSCTQGLGPNLLLLLLDLNVIICTLAISLLSRSVFFHIDNQTRVVLLILDLWSVLRWLPSRFRQK